VHTLAKARDSAATTTFRVVGSAVNRLSEANGFTKGETGVYILLFDLVLWDQIMLTYFVHIIVRFVNLWVVYYAVRRCCRASNEVVT